MPQFDQDIRCTAQGNNTFTAEITNNWSINGIPNGGYMMAMIANALMDQRPTTFTPILTANFLSRCSPGTARLHYEKISSSRQFDRFQAGLHQNGRERIRVLATLANQPSDQTLIRYESPAIEVTDRGDCIPMMSEPGYTLFEQVDVRMDPASAGWTTDRLVEKSEIKGWFKFKDDRPYDLAALFLVADAFPPPVFASQGSVAWVPTIEFSISIRQLPTTEWLKCSFRTRFITGRLLEEDGQVWDESGKLIAISRQIAQYRTNG